MANMSNDTEVDFNLFLPKKISLDEKFAESAARIALHNFEWRYMTLVVFNSLFCGFDVFVQLYDKSVIISKGESDRYTYENTHQYIVFGTNLTNIMQTLQWLSIQQFDNTGKFIVICQSELTDECDEEETMKTFWNYKIINVVLVKSESDLISVYTYFHKCDDSDSKRAVRLDHLDFRINESNKKDSRIFYAKLRNLQKCPLIVSTFIQPPYMTLDNGVPSGADGDLLRIIIQGLNATLTMMTPTRGDGWGAIVNGTWFGSLGDVIDDLANFSITFPAITLSRFRDFQMSIDYNIASLVWIMHPKETLPSSLKLLHPFQTSTLAVLAVTFIFVILFALYTNSKFWKKFSQQMKMAHPGSSLVFHSWMICMGMPANKFPKKTAFLYIALFWIWYGFLIRTFYQASLINSLKTDVRYSNIETVYDFIKADYPIGGGTALRDYYKDEPEVYDRWINMNASEIFANIVAISKGKKFGAAVNLEHAIRFLRKHEGDLYILPQKIVVSPTVIFFKKFSPLAAPVNRVLRRLIEAGIPDKLYKTYSHKLVIAPDTEETRSPIKLEHYTGCYVILLVGWVWALIIFKIEIFCGRNNTKINI